MAQSQQLGLFAQYLTVNSAANSVTIGSNTVVANGFSVATGNLTFNSTGQRIVGDMSNGTFTSRLSFQTNVTNGATSPYIIPNGSSTTAAISVWNSSDINNAGYASLRTDSTAHYIQTGTLGTTSYLPLYFQTSNGAGSLTRMSVAANGFVGIGNTTPAHLLSINDTLFVNTSITIGSGASNSVINTTSISTTTIVVSNVTQTQTNLQVDPAGTAVALAIALG